MRRSTTPTTQNNRATILSDLATLPGEDRRGRLYAALAAYDDALRYRRPENAPLAYATTQNNRANRLSDLATLPGEDRRGRLYAALAAYDDALRYIRPENAPLDYAQTQNNRANILSALATLPGEDRRGRLYAALAAYDDALRYRRPENAPLDYAMTQGNLAILFAALADLEGEDRALRQRAALQAVLTALDFFERVGHAVYVAQAQRLARGLRNDFGADGFAARWAELGLGAMPGWLAEDEIAGVSEDEQEAITAFVQTLEQYQVLLQAADAVNPDVAAWQAITALGEELLTEEPHGWPGIDWAALRKRVASDHNTLGNALDTAGDKPGALAAFERAVELQPDFAMWRRNQTGTLIELGRLDEARAALAIARTLEPDAPRLPDLEADLAAALGEG
jgi:tetratricopeptide (TPR) repeat protein